MIGQSRCMAEQIFTLQPWQAPGKSHGLWEGAQAGANSLQALQPVSDPGWAALNGCTLWKGPMLKIFVKDCLPWVGPTLEQRKSIKRKEQQRHSIPLCHLGTEELGAKLSLSRRDSGGKIHLVLFSFLASLLLAVKYQVWLVMVTGEQSPSPLSFPLLSPAVLPTQRGERTAGPAPRLTHHTR